MAIFFNGRLISIPGSYSEVDASGLEQVGLGASGIVAVIGTAVGGKPVSSSMETDDFLTATRPGQVRTMFRSGNLREAGAILFDPSRDPDISAGAQEVVFMKTNQSTQATLTRSNTLGTSITLTSEDYGAFANQINVTQAAGTSQGYLLTVNFESDSETGDNVGGDNMFSLKYDETGGTGWDTMTAQVLPGGIRANGTRDQAGLDSDVTTGSDGLITVESASAADVTQTVTVYGLVGGVPTRETFTLAGTSQQTSTNIFDAASVFAAELDVVSAGNILVKDDLAATLLTITAATLVTGGVKGARMWVNAGDKVNAVADGASTAGVWMVGKDTSGAWMIDRIVLNGAVGVEGAQTTWTEINFIVLGEVAAARTVAINATAVETLNTVQNTLTKCGDYFNSKTGFTWTTITGLTTFDPADLDLTGGTPENIDGVTVNFLADLFYIMDWYDSSSSLVDATRITFVPTVWDIDITTVANATAYVVTINSTTITYTSDGSATELEINQGLRDLINRHEDLNPLVTAASHGTDTSRVTVTAQGPGGFTISETDTRLTLVAGTTTAGVGQPPGNTTAAEFLTGGAEGASTAADYQTALDLLKKRDINTIVALTHDPATHAAVVAHCDYMAGIGRSERDACLGLLNAAGTTYPTKAEAKTQIQALNTRHVRAFAQKVDRFDTTGERTTFDPWALACVAAGMQAGSDVATPLTFKYTNTLKFTQSSTWNPLDDAEEMINAGLCFLEQVDGVGRRFVRNVTTHLSTSNLAFVEASLNEAANFSSRNFRRNMETAVGKKGFAGTLNAAKSVAVNTLGLLVDREIINTWQALTLSLSADVLEVDVEIAPVIPINFVKNTIHLVTVSLSA